MRSNINFIKHQNSFPFKGLGSIMLSLISILLFNKVSHAQDFHLSQFDANPLYLNPALTGMKLSDDWNYRFNLNYREQRSNFLGHANKIIATGFDMPLDKKFSIGEFIINNKSINGTINALNVMLSGSYKIIHKAANGHERHNMSVGLQVGFMQKSFNQTDFVYDSQYSAGSATGFDNNLPTGENYIKQNTSNFDVNMGMYYHFIDKNKKYSPYGGLSIYHLSQPNQSFTDIHSQTPMRFTLHGGCLYTINEEFSILPQFLYMNQAHANELNIGIMAYDKIRCTDYQPMLGFSWRKDNAVIIHAGLKYKTYNFRVSYDINTYYLKQYGNRGLELSIVFTPKKIVKGPELVATLVILPDSLGMPTDSIKALPNTKPRIKDTTKTIIPQTITKPVVLSDSNKIAGIPEKQIVPVTPIRLEAIPTMPQTTIKFSMNATTTTETETFRIQLGAFKEEVPLDIANRLLKVNAERIENMTDINGNTIYTVGNFKTHDEAIDLRNRMIKEGFTDAFIVKVSAGSLVAPIK